MNKKIGYKRIDARAKKSSRYLGVNWHDSTGTWQVKFGAGGHTVHVGLFKDETKAAKAYNAVAGRFGRPKNRIPLIDNLKHTLSTVFNKA